MHIPHLRAKGTPHAILVEKLKDFVQSLNMELGKAEENHKKKKKLEFPSGKSSCKSSPQNNQENPHLVRFSLQQKRASKIVLKQKRMRSPTQIEKNWEEPNLMV